MVDVISPPSAPLVAVVLLAHAMPSSVVSVTVAIPAASPMKPVELPLPVLLPRVACATRSRRASALVATPAASLTRLPPK